MLRFQALVIWSLWPMTLWTSRYLFVYRCYSGFEYCANWNRKVSCLSWLYYNIILLEQAANICDTDAFFCCLDVSILTGHYLMSRSKYAQYCTLFFKICSAYLFLACPTTHSFRQFCAMLLYADLTAAFSAGPSISDVYVFSTIQSDLIHSSLSGQHCYLAVCLAECIWQICVPLRVQKPSWQDNKITAARTN